MQSLVCGAALRPLPPAQTCIAFVDPRCSSSTACSLLPLAVVLSWASEPSSLPCLFPALPIHLFDRSTPPLSCLPCTQSLELVSCRACRLRQLHSFMLFGLRRYQPRFKGCVVWQCRYQSRRSGVGGQQRLVGNLQIGTTARCFAAAAEKDGSKPLPLLLLRLVCR